MLQNDKTTASNNIILYRTVDQARLIEDRYFHLLSW